MSDNNSVTVMIDSIRSIPNLQEALKPVMSDPVNFIIFSVIFLFFIFNYLVKNTFLLTYLERREDKKQEKIDRYLSNNSNIDEMCAEIVREQRDTIIFKSVTGIYAEKDFRCALIDLHKNMPYDVTWKMIRKSLSRFMLENKKIIVKPITNMEKLTILYNYIVALLLLAIAVIYVIYYVLNFTLTFGDLLTFIAIAFLSGFSSVMVLSQNLPYFFSNIINSELNKNATQLDKC